MWSENMIGFVLQSQPVCLFSVALAAWSYLWQRKGSIDVTWKAIYEKVYCGFLKSVSRVMCSSYSVPVYKLIWKAMCQMQWTGDISCVGLVMMIILNWFTDFTWSEDYFKCVCQFHLWQTLVVVLIIQCFCSAVNIVLSCTFIWF